MKIWKVEINNEKEYVIKCGSYFLKCQIGLNGIIKFSNKKEGDLCTPQGIFKIKSIFYRPDKILTTELPFNQIFKYNKITKNCGWCDDPNHKSYNQYIENKTSKFSGSFEKLWREDRAYDIFVEIGFNDNPIIVDKGSAIFVHCSFEDLRPTSGCIALNRNDLLFLICEMQSSDKILIV